MSSFVELLRENRVPQGPKPDELSTGRLIEAKRLTRLLNSQRGFSFVRLGDFDMAFLLNPASALESFEISSKKVSGTNGFASTGLKLSLIHI